MAVTNDTTTHLALPLPHPSNSLEDDVLRLRSALGGIDSKFQALDALLQSDDATLDQVQELVNAIKENRGDILDLLSGKADDVDLTALAGRVTALEGVAQVEETIVLTEGQTVIDLTVLTGTAGASVFVEGVRLKASEWVPDGVIATRLTLSTTYPAGHEVTVVRQQGGV